ncbi:MAG TPA: Mur ligase family protein [Steroidobacteraceae bacterium]|nr:Mur ligase family protein [Steroidobacteraceae bacterium]
MALELPFEDSRRLTGGNLFFASTGAVLEIVRVQIDDALLAAWRSKIERAGARLGWTRQSVARRHACGASLAIAAPLDQLFLATEVNEWALCAALAERDPGRWAKLEEALIAQASMAADPTTQGVDLLPVIEESAALARFERLSVLEAQPKLRSLLGAAATRGLPYVLDESELTLGAGAGGRNYSLTALPDAAEIPWAELRDIPTAIVTGSNGKTTTVRLLAACARAHGWHAGYNCTDGVFLDDESLALGDYSGPAGARMVMRERRTEAAILETARGGILRRGIAVPQSCTAVVTNVSSDHFGEYGIDDLAALADVKLAVAAVVAPGGLLVLNADDSRLREQAHRLVQRFGACPPLGWFSLNADQSMLREYRLRGASTCGVLEGRLTLNHHGMEHDLGRVFDMPLSMGGVAAYNVANLAGAALAAAALGIAPATIAAVFARFGSNLGDNPGRMMRFVADRVCVLVDYAHNPDGLRGFLRVADHLRRGSGRLGLLLGHAGNRNDADIKELVRVAAEFRPDLVVVKENEAHLRGRAPGEVPRLIGAELKRLGFPDSNVAVRLSEVEAARYALDWARPGDVLALPIHSLSARSTVVAMLEDRSTGQG